VLGAGDAGDPEEVITSRSSAGAGICGPSGTVSRFGVVGANGINSAFGVMGASLIVSALGIVGCGAPVGLAGVGAVIGR